MKVTCYYCGSEFEAHKAKTKCPYCKHSFAAVYPLTTWVMNPMGHLHGWLGYVRPTNSVNRYNYTVNDQDSEIYFQLDSDIQAIMDCLDKGQADILDNGYILYTHSVSDEYFPEEE